MNHLIDNTIEIIQAISAHSMGVVILYGIDHDPKFAANGHLIDYHQTELGRN